MEMNEDRILGLGFIEGINYVKMLESKETKFVNKHNQKIYSSMLRLANDGEPVDLLTVGNDLKKLGFFDEVGGFEYLVWLSQLT
jgi:replicative DNA helicase